MNNKQQESKMNKREFLFLYDAKDCIPNGDPFTGEQRYDEDTQTALVSDVRLKRYIRDFLDNNKDDTDFLNQEIDIVFYSDKSGKKTTGLRAVEISPKKEDIDNLEDLKNKCIDVRLFGTVVAKGKNKDDEYNTQATGAVQFKMFNRTINKVFLPTTQNTTIMVSSDGNTQGSMATFSYLPYGIFSCVGYFNSTTGKENCTSEEDLKKMKIALWNEINTKNTRSKPNTQQSRLLIEIEYNDDYYKIPDIEYSIKIDNEKKFKYRVFDDIKEDLNFSKLEKFLNSSKELIKSLNVYIDSFSFEKDFLNLDDELKKKTKYFTIQGKNIKEL